MTILNVSHVTLFVDAADSRSFLAAVFACKFLFLYLWCCRVTVQFVYSIVTDNLIITTLIVLH
jgi:hypothetical protein